MSKLTTTINLSKLTVAIALVGCSTAAMSAGLDRTGQDIRGFFSEGNNYAEVDFVYIDTNVSGVDHDSDIGVVPKDGNFVPKNDTGNITGEPTFLARYGVKADINNNMVIGVFYDKPWGANVRFENEGNFVSNKDQQIGLEVSPGNTLKVPSTTVNPHINKEGYNLHTSTKIQSESLTGLVGAKMAGVQVYGGPVAQKLQMETHLRGNATGPLSGYDLVTDKNLAYGWAAGVSYSIPEIKLNAALTYRSEIEHDTRFAETVPIMSTSLKGTIASKANANAAAQGRKEVIPADIKETLTTKSSITTPASVNFNFQTGLSKKHQLLGTMNARWVPWSKFEIVPPYYNAFTKANYPDGLALLSYKKDQISVDVGLAKRFTDKLAASAIVGYDSGAGEYTSSMGPVNGMWSLGGGVKYNVTNELAVTAGGKYMLLGNATGVLPTGNVVNKAADNHGFAGVVKISYQED